MENEEEPDGKEQKEKFDLLEAINTMWNIMFKSKYASRQALTHSRELGWLGEVRFAERVSTL